MSGVGRVAAEARRVRAMVDATSAEAQSVRTQVESRITTLAAAAETGTARVAAELGSQIQKVAEYTDAHTSRVAADVSQRLEKEINAAAMSTAATAEITTRTVVEGVRRDIQAQLDANCADALRREEEQRKRVQEISAQLQTLTDQLSKFNPASVSGVQLHTGEVEQKFQQKFGEQQKEIQNLTEIVLESRKDSQTHADTLHNLLMGVENLGENVKKMQEDMVAWQSSYHDAEREYEEMAEDALREVPLPNPAVVPTETTPLAVSTSQIQNPVMQPLFTVPEERQVHPLAQDNVMDAQMDRDLNARWQKLVAPRTTTIPSSSSRPDLLSTTQAKIPEFFNFIGSSSQPAVSSFSIPIIPEGTSGTLQKNSWNGTPECRRSRRQETTKK